MIGERLAYVRLQVLICGSTVIIAIMVSVLLFVRGAPWWVVYGLPPVTLPLAWLYGRALYAGIGRASEGVIRTVLGAGNIPPAPSFSLEESLVARGRYTEAAAGYAARVEDDPRDLDALFAWAALAQEHLQDPGLAERLLHHIRTAKPPPSPQLAARVSNALIDLYLVTDQQGKWMAELARFANAHPGTREGEAARRALEEAKCHRGQGSNE